jgi:hypothetical protein
VLCMCTIMLMKCRSMNNDDANDAANFNVSIDRHKKTEAFASVFGLKNKIIFQRKHVQSRSRLKRPYVVILLDHVGQEVLQHRQGRQENHTALRGRFQG